MYSYLKLNMNKRCYLYCDIIDTIEALNCTFEMGFCDWHYPMNANGIQWTRRRGSTPSSGTGPSSDHTLGTSQGRNNVLILWAHDIKELPFFNKFCDKILFDTVIY